MRPVEPPEPTEDDIERAQAIYDDGLRQAREWQEEARRDAALHDPVVWRILNSPPPPYQEPEWRDEP